MTTPEQKFQIRADNKFSLWNLLGVDSKKRRLRIHQPAFKCARFLHPFNQSRSKDRDGLERRPALQCFQILAASTSSSEEVRTRIAEITYINRSDHSLSGNTNYGQPDLEEKSENYHNGDGDDEDDDDEAMEKLQWHVPDTDPNTDRRAFSPITKPIFYDESSTQPADLPKLLSSCSIVAPGSGEKRREIDCFSQAISHPPKRKTHQMISDVMSGTEKKKREICGKFRQSGRVRSLRKNFEESSKKSVNIVRAF